MPPKTTLRFADDISIVVPNSLDLITTYVLQEQGDWFEDEIHFVRQLLQKGQKAIDIGANYGIFTLTIAKTVGAEGKVWAFEPTSTTAALLTESIKTNQWQHIIVDQSALSDHEGSAKLALNENTELNELIREDQPAGSFETVKLTTLDSAMNNHGWGDIDFIKIDAEGEEEAIIRGGQRFFHTESPLVQYEIKASQNLNLRLTQAFKAIGYDSYRLVPGLGMLTPFEPHGLVDDYLLNLFCCKPDRARVLATAGKLILPEDAGGDESALDLLTRLKALPTHAWHQTLNKFPYGRLLMRQWGQTTPSEASHLVYIALTLYATAMDRRYEPRDRFHALRLGTGLLVDLCNKLATPARLMTLSRLARAFGARKAAVLALSTSLEGVKSSQRVDLSEPFLTATSYFEAIDPQRSIADWFVGCALEGLERNESYSSFYSGPASIQRLEHIQQTGFGSPEMLKRLALVRQRFSL
jgi:FkbM family methyltransferase